MKSSNECSLQSCLVALSLLGATFFEIGVIYLGMHCAGLEQVQVPAPPPPQVSILINRKKSVTCKRPFLNSTNTTERQATLVYVTPGSVLYMQVEMPVGSFLLFLSRLFGFLPTANECQYVVGLQHILRSTV